MRRILLGESLSQLQDRLHVVGHLLVLQVEDELGPAGGIRVGCFFAQAVQSHVGGEELGGRQVALAAFDVLPVVAPQTLPRGGVEQEGRRLKHDGDADVQVAVGHVVVQQASALFATHRAPEQTCRVDAHAKDQRRRDEAWSGDHSIIIVSSSRSKNSGIWNNSRDGWMDGWTDR